MFAVVEIQGKQYEVRVGDVIHVDTMHLEDNTVLTIDNVLLVSDNGSVTVGTPYVAGTTVSAEVVNEEKGDKIRVFKMKAKKRYRRTLVLRITAIGGVKAAPKKAEEVAA
jgi:large subunit ribosomal protein L21